MPSFVNNRLLESYFSSSPSKSLKNKATDILKFHSMAVLPECVGIFNENLQLLDIMVRHDHAKSFGEPVIEPLARAIARKINCSGDHSTAFPPLSLHRRDGPSEPIACIYGLGLAVTIQGGKSKAASLQTNGKSFLLRSARSLMLAHLQQGSRI